MFTLASKVLDKIHNTVAVAIFVIIPVGKKTKKILRTILLTLPMNNLTKLLLTEGQTV